LFEHRKSKNRHIEQETLFIYY